MRAVCPSGFTSAAVWVASFSGLSTSTKLFASASTFGPDSALPSPDAASGTAARPAATSMPVFAADAAAWPASDVAMRLSPR